MKLLAIIVNYRTPDSTLRALASLVREIDGMDAKAIVVDNDSDDGSYERIARAVEERGFSSNVEIVRAPENGGFGYGNNFAIRRAYDAKDPPDYFFLLNPDAVVEAGALKTLVSFLDAHPEVGIAGPRISGFDGTQHVSAFRFPTPIGDLESGLKLGLATRLLARWVVAPREWPTATGPTDWVSGSSVAIRREVFETIGLFDEKFFLYFEETDLCLRAKRAGFEVYYVHEAQARHEGGLATGIYRPGARLPPYWFASRRRFFQKNYGTIALFGANALFALGYALFRIRRRIQQKPDLDPPHLLSDFLRHSLFPANGETESLGT
jgi:N-acetylglucosaminyl-diphospho-decaprenol L-rhamnosyltransferase